MHTRPFRDRHGRGVRGPLLPTSIPRYRTRRDAFDEAVLAAYTPLASRFAEQLATLDLAVDTVPRMRMRADMTVLPDDIFADGPVPLGRLLLAGVDRVGQPIRPRLVIFRMPVESRCRDAAERDELLRTAMTSLVATFLNLSPWDIDPDYSW